MIQKELIKLVLKAVEKQLFKKLLKRINVLEDKVAHLEANSLKFHIGSELKD